MRVRQQPNGGKLSGAYSEFTAETGWFSSEEVACRAVQADMCVVS